MEKGLLEELGFKAVLNGAGHYTVYGGSCPGPEVVELMGEASRSWVDMKALELRAGEWLASRLGCEDGLVTSGAYAANLVAVHAAVGMAEEVRGKLARPNVVIQSPHITRYADSFRAGEVELKVVKRRSASDRLAGHIDESTVAVAYVVNEAEVEFSLLETVEACADARIPALVDAAVVDPPISGVKDVLAFGPDSVSVSGGKGLNGPNATGLLLGKKKLVDRARQLAFPNYGPGRAMKVSKEQIVGLLAAVKQALEKDEAELVRVWKRRAERIVEGLGGVRGATSEVLFPWALNFPQPVARVRVHLEEAGAAMRVEKMLAAEDPAIILRPVEGQAAETDMVIDVRTFGDEQTGALVEGLKRAIGSSGR
jgi:L-seryl-tRNA(Ser) seleniumtransferase